MNMALAFLRPSAFAPAAVESTLAPAGEITITLTNNSKRVTQREILSGT
jgi:hypothetical protein